MHSSLKRAAILVTCGLAVSLGGCVSKSEHKDLQARYDTLAGQNQQLQGQNQQLQGQNQQLLAQNQQLQGQSQQLQGDVSRLQNAVKYTVNSDLLFPSGSWQMSAAGQDVIGKLASQLAPSQQRRLVVNGYTDNAPIGRGLQKAGITSNEVLSQKRAEAVMQYLVSKGFNPNLLAARGWGEAQPVAPNNTPAGRAQNRRVEITLASAS